MGGQRGSSVYADFLDRVIVWTGEGVDRISLTAEAGGVGSVSGSALIVSCAPSLSMLLATSKSRSRGVAGVEKGIESW
jgi:hypothetical protein